MRSLATLSAKLRGAPLPLVERQFRLYHASVQIRNLADIYQAKSDEELLHLASAPEDLTVEARLALEGEVTRRQLNRVVSVGKPESTVVKQASAQLPDSQGVADFVADVLRVYHAHFWLFFVITA